MALLALLDFIALLAFISLLALKAIITLTDVGALMADIFLYPCYDK